MKILDDDSPTSGGSAAAALQSWRLLQWLTAAVHYLMIVWLAMAVLLLLRCRVGDDCMASGGLAALQSWR